jgi:hypothetical protein
MKNDLVGVINGIVSFCVAGGSIALLLSLQKYKTNPIASRLRLLPLFTFITSGILGFYISIFPEGDNFWILRAFLTAGTAIILFYLAYYFSGRRS